jgi:hypothetical protein
VEIQIHNYVKSLLTPKPDKIPDIQVEFFEALPVYDTLTLMAEAAGISTYPVKKMIEYHKENCPEKKLRYWGYIDFSLHSKEERFYEFDVQLKTLTKYHVAHGKGSDEDFDGYLDKWSNKDGSLCSSKGLYLCSEPYTSTLKFGRALRLDGLDTTNSNARDRGVVLHGADYVDPKYIKKNGKAGRTYGCFGVSFDHISSLINKFKNGSFIYAWDGVVPPDGHNEEVEPNIKEAHKYLADWDGKTFGNNWTLILQFALESYGKDLLNMSSIKDSSKWCPRFALLNREQKKQFFIMLISSMARHESNFDPKCTYTESFEDANGKRVVSRGLLQISKESANSSRYKGNVKNESDLHDVAKNLEVGVMILNYWIPKDGYIGSSNVSGISNAGGGRYWSVMRDKSRSHADIVKRVKSLKFT